MRVYESTYIICVVFCLYREISSYQMGIVGRWELGCLFISERDGWGGGSWVVWSYNREMVRKWDKMQHMFS